MVRFRGSAHPRDARDEARHGIHPRKHRPRHRGGDGRARTPRRRGKINRKHLTRRARGLRVLSCEKEFRTFPTTSQVFFRPIEHASFLLTQALLVDQLSGTILPFRFRQELCQSNV